ncbi:MAG TPA: cytochrome b/b6 domain-containing protein [Acetobacteraceae bacterium]|nr:cytochrome b/b6 domain-containing protein [Acetobacteraceae bacterium]
MAAGDMRVRVWDLPVRLFHWGIVALVIAAWATQYVNRMGAHRICGYSVFAALLFRLIWGFVGSDTARFSHFLRSPAAALARLRYFTRLDTGEEIGHNAAGGWMVILMLVLLAIQVGTGLCATNDVDFAGPFSDWVGQDCSDTLTTVHSWNFTVIEAAIAVHVLAVIAYHVVRRQNLVGPMITGVKRMRVPPRTPRMASAWLALAVAASAGIVVGFVVTWP